MTTPAGGPLETLRAGGRRAIAAALARIEAAPDDPETLALIDAAYAAPRAHVVGITGPPGVGKSSLASRLIQACRRQGRTVGVIAIDPSSRRTGGALLGDRTRFDLAPDDPGVFVRSLASRGRLGGLAALAPAAMVALRAVYDVVLIETVGVGQAEIEVAMVADSVVLCVQPGAGDSLQYLKAGIAEIPDVAVVTKGDLADLARRTWDDLRAALGAQARDPGWATPVVMVSARDGWGIEHLIEAIDDHRAWLAIDGRLEARRALQAAGWVEAYLLEEFGRAGLAQAAGLTADPRAAPASSPFARMRDLYATLHPPKHRTVSRS